MYHHWECTSIYWPLFYPLRSLTIFLVLRRFKENPGKELGNLSADLTHTYISKQGAAAASGSSAANSLQAGGGASSSNLAALSSGKFYNIELAIKSTLEARRKKIGRENS